MTRTTWLIGFLLGATGVCGAASIRAVGCAPTVEAAITRLLAQEQSNADTGYRIASVRVDRLLGRTWALVASCSAPSAPLLAVELPPVDAMSSAIVLTRVQMGDSVRVVRRGDGSQMQVSGVAQQAGALGEWIRVTLPRFGEDTSEPVPVIQCRVVGQGVVEALR